MQTEKNFIYSYDERECVVQYIQSMMKTHRIFACVGPLGAGKTTIIRDVLRMCGVAEPITSPTFTYVNQYETCEGERIYHFDLYRIHSLQAFQEQGFDEYLNEASAFVFIEWPEVIKPILQCNTCWLLFDYCEESDKRHVTIRCSVST